MGPDNVAVICYILDRLYERDDSSTGRNLEGDQSNRRTLLLIGPREKERGGGGDRGINAQCRGEQPIICLIHRCSPQTGHVGSCWRSRTKAPLFTNNDYFPNLFMIHKVMTDVICGKSPEDELQHAHLTCFPSAVVKSGLMLTWSREGSWTQANKVKRWMFLWPGCLSTGGVGLENTSRHGDVNYSSTRGRLA